MEARAKMNILPSTTRVGARTSAVRGAGGITEGSARGVVVLIEPDVSVFDALKKLLQGFSWSVEPSLALGSLKQLLEQQDITAVISEASVPECAAAEILRTCAAQQVPVIFTGHDVSTQAAVDLMRKGAIDFLDKPFSQERLLDLLNQLTNRHNGQAIHH
jgi:DNA-binding NtrC family response regulator